ncbi:MAG: type II toxin-antitoxin system prevent-host-death family antitoxin [Acidimicrobiales bacterium]
MAIQMNISEAKAKLSELLDAAQSGQEVIIARSGKAIAKLTALNSPPDRQLGFMEIDIDDALFDPLPGPALQEWE